MIVARTPSETASTPFPTHTSLGFTTFLTEVSLFGEDDLLGEADGRFVVEKIWGEAVEVVESGRAENTTDSVRIVKVTVF